MNNVSYGVNVKLYENDCYSRFDTFDKVEDAEKCLERLDMDNELYYCIEIETITLVNGDYAYKKIKETLVKYSKPYWNKQINEIPCISAIGKYHYEDTGYKYTCYLKVGYMYEGKGCFNFNTIEEYNEKLTSVINIKETKNIKLLKDYLKWLDSYENVFIKSPLESLCDVMFDKEDK